MLAYGVCAYPCVFVSCATVALFFRERVCIAMLVSLR
ncbi:hypothetical protein ANAPC3_00197 [Anaplasma phagocytophilum]|nr:hypothetical protein ANAPC3_00197 [Anaplasma phagocytophilum]